MIRPVYSFARVLACSAAAVLSLVGAAAAYPDHSIVILAGSPPGGGIDTMSRLLAPILSKELGQPVVVENRAGANGTIAEDQVAKAPPDGYLLTIVTAAHSLTAAQMKLPYDPVNDFTPICLLTKQPDVLVINPTQVPVNTLAQFIAYAKAHPNKLNFGSGVDDPPSLMTTYFSYLTGIKVVDVAYAGTAPEMVALLGGEIQAVFQSMSTAVPQIKAGKVRALAVSLDVRSPALPDVPTVDEAAGLRDFDLGAWYGVLAPPGMPEDITDELNKAFVDAMNSPEMEKVMQEDGIIKVAGTPEQFLAFEKQDIAEDKKITQISAGK